MTHFPDLSANTYHGLLGNVQAIGWLEHGMPFPTGATSRQFRKKLLWLLSFRFAKNFFLGLHYCDMCAEQGRTGPDARSSQWGIFVPSKSCVYEAPSWIGHYVISHKYQPPTCFQDAVLSCPPPDSSEYIELLQVHVKFPSSGDTIICRTNPNRTLFRSLLYGREPPKGYDSVLFRLISEIGVSRDIAEHLSAINIVNFGDVLKLSRDGLLKIHEFSELQVDEIEKALLSKCALSLDQKLTDWPSR